MKPRIVALVPMRHHSERVPGKNYRMFAGHPLYHHIVKTLLDCPLVDEIAIDTDSPIILEDAARNFPQVKLIKRPQNLRADTIPMNDVLLYDVNQINADYYVQTHSTNPLLCPTTITRAIEEFLRSLPEHDSLFSVTRIQARLWDTQGKPVNHDPGVLLRTQDLAPIFEENSNLYVFSRKVLEGHHNRIGERPLMFEIDKMETWDIDEELDFEIAEFLYLKYREGE
ncbi:CMP-N,N'-diacetyllegionaminic acid synthase [subsurface metagenome]